MEEVLFFDLFKSLFFNSYDFKLELKLTVVKVKLHFVVVFEYIYKSIYLKEFSGITRKMKNMNIYKILVMTIELVRK